jgi:hypothetical protein
MTGPDYLTVIQGQTLHSTNELSGDICKNFHYQQLLGY